MDILALKLVLTPVLIGGASLAGRRWGQGVGGWLVGLPLTAGPVAFFLALEYGPGAAAASALGSLAGVIAEAGFCLGYGWAARLVGWPLSFLAGTVAFAAVAALLQQFELNLLPVFLAAMASLAAIILLMPRGGGTAAAAPILRWDIPARMAVATALVLALTGLAPVLGAGLSGMLATFPVFAGTLTVFAHRLLGAGAARGVLRGLLFGLFSFAGFFPVLAALVERAGMAAAFAAAIAVSLAVQGGTLWLVRRDARRSLRQG